jgi:hypothetical protein
MDPMIKHSLTVAVASLALAVGASRVEAQARPSISVSGGASIPTGDLGDVEQTGWNANIGVGFRPALSPVGVRVEGMWHELDGEGTLLGDAPDYRVLGFTANLVYELPGLGVRPYLIGGGGLYNHKLDLDGADSENDFGLNGGIGIRVPLTGFDTFLEARFHNVFDAILGESAQFVPITFGIAF